MIDPPRHYWLVAVRCRGSTHCLVVRGAVEAFDRARREIRLIRPDLKNDPLHGIPLGQDAKLTRKLPQGVEAMLTDLGPRDPKLSPFEVRRMAEATLPGGPLS